jgi:uncharacterized protein (TIGR02569 family)
MSENIPDQSILTAFGVSGEPVLLQGGEGTCYRVDHLVFKPTNNAIETSWIADLNSSLSSPKFRIPKPIRAKDGSWVFNGWAASEFLQGEHRADRYTEAIEVCKDFHRALVDIPKPDWFDKKRDVFSLSDRMAWGELPIPDFELAEEPFKKIFGFLDENRLPNQLIHGDWGLAQILFHDQLPPAVLDMTPYFRPADFPIADMILSAIVDDGADISLLDSGKGIKEFDQLLLRAFVFRTCTYVGFQIHPENNYDWTSVIVRHLNMVDVVIDKINPKTLNY